MAIPAISTVSFISMISVTLNVVSMACQYDHKKGHWRSIASSPTFSIWDFYTIRTVGMGNDCMLSFTSWIDLLPKKYEYVN